MCLAHYCTLIKPDLRLLLLQCGTDTTGESSGRCVFQVPDEEEENEESLAHADHSKNKAEV